MVILMMILSFSETTPWNSVHTYILTDEIWYVLYAETYKVHFGTWYFRMGSF